VENPQGTSGPLRCVLAPLPRTYPYTLTPPPDAGAKALRCSPLVRTGMAASSLASLATRPRVGGRRPKAGVRSDICLDPDIFPGLAGMLIGVRWFAAPRLGACGYDLC